MNIRLEIGRKFERTSPSSVGFLRRGSMPAYNSLEKQLNLKTDLQLKS